MNCFNFDRSRIAASVAAAFVVMAAAPGWAVAPSAGVNITDSVVRLSSGSWLRYSDSPVGRIHSTTSSAMELKGWGSCRTTFCPVKFNGIELWAQRSRLDLIRPSATSTFSRDRTLRLDDSGDDVRAAQNALILAGYKITANGKYGRSTQGAVRNFQRKRWLSADGSIGPLTRAKLQF